jgi:DNA polymerase
MEAERALALAVPELSSFEKKVSALSTRSNDLGIRIDLGAVKALQAVGAKLTAGFVAEAEALTSGAITDVSTQHVRMLPWLAARGLPLPGLGKEVVAGALAAGVIDPVNRRLLELRQLSAKSSLAKLPMMTSCVGADGRARDQIQYYGAGRTGRWAGRLIQPQNLPRPDGLDAEVALRTIMAEGEVPEIVYANPLKVISACLRPCIVAGPGKVLVALDLSQIEARVTAWLAGEDRLIEAFAQGRDVYTEMALKLGSDNRQLGKVMTLACQYGMGWETFQKQAREQYDVELSSNEAMDAVRVYREENPAIQILWWDMETAALGAIGVPNKRWRDYGRGALGGVTYAGALNRIAMKKVGPTLAIRKPNGGKLFYHNPRSGPGKYDTNFMFDGPGRKSGVWREIPAWGGFLTENITQAVARDVMAEAVARIYEALGLVPVMTVHDEAVYEIDEEKLEDGLVRKIEVLFNEPPAWASGLPIASEIKCGERYVK